MKRSLYESLCSWKKSPNRKPLILQGARQVGKTWLMKEFGKNEDVGLLNAFVKVDARILLEKNAILTEFKGALTEQFIVQQLVINHDLYYWTATNATAEVDLLVQHQNEIVPIEVKAEENLKSKSLKVFFEKYKPKRCFRTSMSPYREQEWMTNVPLYGIAPTINCQ